MTTQAKAARAVEGAYDEVRLALQALNLAAAATYHGDTDAARRSFAEAIARMGASNDAVRTAAPLVSEWVRTAPERKELVDVP